MADGLALDTRVNPHPTSRKIAPYLRGITVLRAIHSFLTACRMQRGTAGSNSRDMLADRTSTYGTRFSGDSSVRCSRICTSLGLLDGKLRKAGTRRTEHDSFRWKLLRRQSSHSKMTTDILKMSTVGRRDCGWRLGVELSSTRFSYQCSTNISRYRY